MSVVSQSAAQASADQIKNETAKKANTAARVGQLFRDIADSTRWGAPPVDVQFLWVDCKLSTEGNGSRERPFKTLRAAINAAPLRSVGMAKIYLAPCIQGTDGYYDGARIVYVDKRLSIEGTFMLNESPEVPTFGVNLGPTSSDNSPLGLEIIRTNSNITAQSGGIKVFMQDAHCEGVADGINYADFLMAGTTPRFNIVSFEGTVNNSVSGYNYALSQARVTESIEMHSGELLGGYTYTAPAGRFYDSFITGSASLTISGALEMYNCRFSDDCTASVFSASTCKTDLATYARGVRAGLTWPSNMVFIDHNVRLQPAYVGSGTGSNVGLSTNATPSLPTNVAGDVFICRVNAINGTSPTMPVGWFRIKEQVSGAMISQAWVRTGASSGGESGTVTVTNGGGLNFPLEAMIDCWRNADTGTAGEGITGASQTGSSPIAFGGPTVAAAGPGRTAVACVFSNSTTGPTGAQITGSTGGGAWIEKTTAQFFSGLGSSIDLHSATLADSGTITGGAGSMPGTIVNVIGFALIGALA